jgi:hypothetical protein
MKKSEELNWTPESLFFPSKKHPNGSSGEWLHEENGIMVNSIYEDGKLVSKEPFVWSEKESNK